MKQQPVTVNEAHAVSFYGESPLYIGIHPESMDKIKRIFYKINKAWLYERIKSKEEHQKDICKSYHELMEVLSVERNFVLAALCDRMKFCTHNVFENGFTRETYLVLDATIQKVQSIIKQWATGAKVFLSDKNNPLKDLEKHIGTL